MIERLPTPWGLVRLGVAPDHPKIKAVSRAFEKIARRPGLPLPRQRRGRPRRRRTTSSRGSTTPSSTPSARRPTGGSGSPARTCPARGRRPRSSPGTTATPTSRTSHFDLSCERAVVIGNGNVAVDVARMLALDRARSSRRPTRPTRRSTRSSASGDPRDRRCSAAAGPAQAAFTHARAEGARRARRRRRGRRSRPTSSSTPRARPRSPTHARPRARNIEVLREYAAREPAGKPRTLIRLRFLRLARRDPRRRARRGGRGRAQRRSSPTSAGSSARSPTDEREAIPCGIVFRSVGYRGVALPGVPFDEDARRRSRTPTAACSTRRRAGPGVYCAGWIKRGPSGVIGTNKKDATETVELLLEDAARRAARARGEPATLDALLAERGVALVVYAGWEAIDAHERAPRRAAGPPARQARAPGTSCSRRAPLGRRSEPHDLGAATRLEP